MDDNKAAQIVPVDKLRKYVDGFMERREKSLLTSWLTPSEDTMTGFCHALTTCYPAGTSKRDLDVLMAVLITQKRYEGNALLPKFIVEAVLTEQKRDIEKRGTPCPVCRRVVHRYVSDEEVERLRNISVLKRKTPAPVYEAMKRMIKPGESFRVNEAIKKFDTVAKEITVKKYLNKMVAEGFLTVQNKRNRIYTRPKK